MTKIANTALASITCLMVFKAAFALVVMFASKMN
jgi:hypothetical protein